MERIMVRNAEKAMYRSIREQRINAYREYIEVLPEDHWNALRKSISSTVAEQEEVELIVALSGEKMVGSVALFPAKIKAYEGNIEEMDYPEIRMLAVASDTRGQGVASALISECIKRTKVKGFSRIGLHTGEFMKNAIDLYEKMGFQRIPQYDFIPANDGIIVRAYQLKLSEQK